MQLSIVITTFNALPYLKLCLTSLLETTTGDCEIVIYADGSGPATRSYLESLEDSRVRWQYQSTNIGICGALNRAAGMATGEYLYFINDDMVFAPGWREALFKHSAPGRVLTGTVIEPPLPNLRIASCHIAHDFGLNNETFDREAFNGGAALLAEDRVEPGINYPFLIARELFHKIGGVDERFPGPAHDPDVFYRVALAGVEMLRVRNSLCYHFSGRSLRFAGEATQVSRSWIEAELKGKIAFLQKWGEKQRYSFGGVPRPKHTKPDQKWSLGSRLKLMLLGQRYRRRAARQLKKIGP